MRYLFLAGEVAISVGHWLELSDDGNERGARVQLQRLHEEPPRDYRGAATVMLVDEPIWRADLFTWLGGPAGNWDRAHYHTEFKDMSAGARIWDAELSRDPVGWAAQQLRDFASLLRAGGASDLAEKVDQREIDRASPAIVSAIRQSMEPEPD